MAINRIKTGGITDNTIQSGDIAPGTIASDRIAPGTIASDRIAPGTIANDRLANTSITINGTSIALGASGEIVAGTDWQAVTVADGSTQLNAVAGKGYFLDTSSGVIDVKLPTSPTRGDTIVLADYGNTFATNRVVVDTGGKLIDSVVGGSPGSSGFAIETNGAIVELVFADDTAGWIIKQNNAPSDLGAENYTKYIAATGGTVATSGDFKIHTFTGDGCFVVSQAGEGEAPNTVDYLVVAGGGGGGNNDWGGGGGAGGFREAKSGCAGCYTASPLATPTGLTMAETTYPITVGGGGAAGSPKGVTGSSSIFSTITSTGGGGGGIINNPGNPGGSGGGGGGCIATSGGTGNTPPVSPPQGNNGGQGYDPAPESGGGGGGATQAGNNGGGGGGGPGGAGATTSFSGSPTAYSGGGGGAQAHNYGGSGGSGGTGGGGAGVGTASGNPGTANTGGGGGNKGNGGKGIVIIRYKFQ